MLGETQENGNGHQIRSWISTVVRPGVVQAAGSAGENSQDFPGVWVGGVRQKEGVPLRSSLEGPQEEKPVDTKLLRGEHEAPHGAWRSEQEGAEHASE